MQPYTYLIGWIKLDKWYYGCQYNRNSDPNDLWKTYFTSSKEIKQFRREHGKPDVIEIRKVFDCPKKARLWENKVLRRLPVYKNPKWLNEVSGAVNFHRIGLPGTFTGRNHSETTKEKISKANKGRLSGEKNPSKRPEVGIKISKALKGKKFSKEHCEALSKVRKNVPKSEEFKSTISKTMKKRWEDKSIWLERNQKIKDAHARRRQNKGIP